MAIILPDFIFMHLVEHIGHLLEMSCYIVCVETVVTTYYGILTISCLLLKSLSHIYTNLCGYRKV